MQEQSVRWWHYLLAALLFIGSLVGIAYGAWYLLRTLTHLSPPVLASLITASGTVLVATFSLIVQRRWERKRVIEQEHRQQMAPVYGGFVAAWFKVTEATKDARPDDDEKPIDEVIAFLKEFMQKLLLWGSDEVVREFVAFEKAAIAAADSNEETQPASLLALERLMLAMRRDLGHRNKGLAEGDLLRTFINDWDAAVSSALGEDQSGATTDDLA